MKYKLHHLEVVATPHYDLRRLAVPGGWLYMRLDNDGNALAFVPDASVEIEEGV